MQLQLMTHLPLYDKWILFMWNKPQFHFLYGFCVHMLAICRPKKKKCVNFFFFGLYYYLTFSSELKITILLNKKHKNYKIETEHEITACRTTPDFVYADTTRNLLSLAGCNFNTRPTDLYIKGQFRSFSRLIFPILL